MNDTAIVGEGQTAQGLRTQRCGLVRRQRRAAQPLSQRLGRAQVVQHIGPVLAARDLARQRQIRMREPRHPAHRLVPAPHGDGIARLFTRQQQQLRRGLGGLRPQIAHPPRHRVPALAKQGLQLEHTETPRRHRPSGRRRCGRERVHGGMAKTVAIETPMRRERCRELRREPRLDRCGRAACTAARSGRYALCQNCRKRCEPGRRGRRR